MFNFLKKLSPEPIHIEVGKSYNIIFGFGSRATASVISIHSIDGVVTNISTKVKWEGSREEVEHDFTPGRFRQAIKEYTTKPVTVTIQQCTI